MGAKLQTVESVAIEEVPGLREACEAEAAAVKLIHDLKLRLQTAKSSIVLRQRDRDALASRVARGENVTGADLRQATEAVSDAEGTVKLIEDAMPKAISAAKEASSSRGRAENAVYERARQPYLDALAEAEAALRLAQGAVDAAKAKAERLPADAKQDLDALLDQHGLDRSAGDYVRKMQDIHRTNVALMEHNRAFGAHAPRPLLAWPP